MSKYARRQKWSESQLGEMRALFSYDPETGIISSLVNRRKKAGDSLGTTGKRGYVAVKFAGTFLRAHRLAWFLHNGEWPVNEIDHINGNPSDNRIANLRLASRSQNRHNIKTPIRNKLGVKGVHIDAGFYRAIIYVRVAGQKKKLDLGRFSCEEMAGLAYLTAADRYFGDYARDKSAQCTMGGNVLQDSEGYSRCIQRPVNKGRRCNC